MLKSWQSFAFKTEQGVQDLFHIPPEMLCVRRKEERRGFLFVSVAAGVWHILYGDWQENVKHWRMILET